MKSKFFQIFSTLKFPGSVNYWEKRYKLGLNSGEGSYGKLAEFKAEVINQFVQEEKIQKIIEFGCGDGNQLTLAKYPQYLGLDVSGSAIHLCIAKFQSDLTKSFLQYNPNNFENMEKFLSADLTLSLDVIYHLTEEEIFEKYMENLFKMSERFVMIYSSNKEIPLMAKHVKHRKFTDFVESKYSNFKLIKTIKNKYPESSVADFFIYEKII